MSRKTIICLLVAVFSVSISLAAPPCRGKLIDPMDMCWDCMYPITIGGMTVKGGKLPDTPNPHRAFCTCGHFPYISFGTTTGFWEPFSLADVTRTPYCMVNLGGTVLPIHTPWSVVGDETTSPNDSESFYNVHIYHFPLFKWLGIFPSCGASGNFSIQYLSELDPTWSDDRLAAILHPETKLYANPAAQSACFISAMGADTGLPNDGLFWCAGSQGGIYPLVGNVAYHESGAQASVLLTERAGFLMHQQGQWPTTDGSHALCGGFYNPVMRPSQYRYQPLYPKNKRCRPFGRTTLGWAGGLETPVSSENYAYVIWQKINCCDTL